MFNKFLITVYNRKDFMHSISTYLINNITFIKHAFCDLRSLYLYSVICPPNIFDKGDIQQGVFLGSIVNNSIIRNICENGNKSYYNKGLLIYHYNEFLGVIKFVGEPVFFSSIKSSGLKKNHFYTLPLSLENYLRDYFFRNKKDDDWLAINLCFELYFLDPNAKLENNISQENFKVANNLDLIVKEFYRENKKSTFSIFTLLSFDYDN